MAFTFQMQKILDYKEQLKEEASVRLAEAEARLNKEEEHLQGLKKELSAKEDELSKNVEIEHALRWLIETYIKGLKADIYESVLRLRQYREVVETSRAMLLERAKEQKLLEKLKEKQRERYYAEERELERKINDETATLRHGNKTI